MTEKEGLTGNQDCFVTSRKDTARPFNVNSWIAVDHVHLANGYPQKKDVNHCYCYQCPQ